MIFVGSCGGKNYRLPKAVKVEINQELYVPADDLTVEFPYVNGFPSLQKIYAVENKCVNIDKAIEEKNILFGGIVDEQILIADINSASIKIYARSMAAVLLDNECEPIMYVNPSVDTILKRHLEPFGIEVENSNKKCRSGELGITKGSSHYKAVEKFCVEFLNSVPRIDCKGICRFDTFDNVGSIEFDNKNGIKFESVSVCENRYSRISRVYISGDNGYDTAVNDYESQGIGIVRERYLNLASSETRTLSDADNIIRNGIMQSFSVTLMCEGNLLNKIGYSASVNIDICKGKRFVVSQVRYTAEETKEKSRVKLILSVSN